MKALGTFELNAEHVEVYVDETDPGCSGWFCVSPVSTKGDRLPARIVVGKGQDRAKCIGTILHEAFEFCALRNRLRYCHGADVQNLADFLFVLDHQQMDRVVNALAVFIAEVLPTLDEKIKWNPTKNVS